MGQLLSSEPNVGEAEEEAEESDSESEPTSDMGSTSSKSTVVEEEDKPIIMVLGGPGTGKGTQCSRMVKEFGFKHISLGDILRDEVKQGTQLGKECAEIMKQGKLVPVNLTLEMMKKAMKSSTDATGYLLDGFPRATSQARAFQKQVRNPAMVLYLHAPQNVLLQRLTQRGLSSGRADDNVETIKKRFNTFKKESLPVVSFYENNSTCAVKKVCTITAPDDVYKQIQTAVKSVLTSTKPFRKHMRRRGVSHAKEAEKTHIKRLKSRRSKKPRSVNECSVHIPPPPPPSQECIIM